MFFIACNSVYINHSLILLLRLQKYNDADSKCRAKKIVDRPPRRRTIRENTLKNAEKKKKLNKLMNE